jgi:hypothetical protein
MPRRFLDGQVIKLFEMSAPISSGGSETTSTPTCSPSAGFSMASGDKPPRRASTSTPATSSSSGSSTTSARSEGERNGSGRAASSMSASGPGSSVWTLSSTELEARYETLSPTSQATLRQIALPLSLGCSQSEIAGAIGITASFVDCLLDELRSELR